MKKPQAIQLKAGTLELLQHFAQEQRTHQEAAEAAGRNIQLVLRAALRDAGAEGNYDLRDGKLVPNDPPMADNANPRPAAQMV